MLAASSSTTGRTSGSGAATIPAAAVGLHANGRARTRRDRHRLYDLGFWELYTRWLQYAAFLPMFRSHGTDVPREIWRFGEEGSPFYDAIAACIRLRYRLLPYIYSLAARGHAGRQ